MKKLQNFLLVCMCLVFWPLLAYATDSTQTTDTRFLFHTNLGDIGRYGLWEFQAWTTQIFSGKLINNSVDPVDVYIWFVDWWIQSWEFLWCKNEWDVSEIGKYITLTNISWNKITIPWKSNVELDFQLRLPWIISSGIYAWCITHYVTWVSETWCNFSLLPRKANVLDILINGTVDPTQPEISDIVYWTWLMDLYVDDSGVVHNIWCEFNPINPTERLPIWTDIKITFTEPVDKNSLSLDILPRNTNFSHISPDWDELWMSLVIHLSGRLEYDKNYEIELIWVVDSALNPLLWNNKINFTTIKDPNISTGWSSWNGWGNPWWGWAWWGWISKPEKDNCPAWDTSPSLYDWNCGDYREVEENHGVAIQSGWNCSVINSEYSDELNQAYTYACGVWITTMPSIQQADMMWPLLRKHLAKMISEFAIKELWINPDTSKECNFDDMDWETQEMKYFAQKSCQLWLMWLHSDWISVKDNFDPNEQVTRAQFGTVLSRLLWWTTYAANDGELYYINHLQALKNNGIMTQIYGNWPDSVELRWWVMLMLMRVNQRNLVEYTPKDQTWTILDIVQEWIYALIDNWNINVSMENFENWVMWTTWDYIHIVWRIDPSRPVKYVSVTHKDTRWEASITDYRLVKFEPSSHYFRFNAYRYYNSLTVNDKNTYEFKFYDEDAKLMFHKTVIIHQNYLWKR